MANRKASIGYCLLWCSSVATLLLCLCLAGAISASDDPLPPSPPSPIADHPFRISVGANPGSPLPWVPRSWFWGVLAALVVIGIAAALMARMLVKRKKTAAAFAERERQFRQIAANIREVFWVGTLDFQRLIYASPAYETIWGRSCESLYAAPQSWLESIFPPDRESVMAFIEREKSGRFDGGTFPEFRIVRPNGDIRWIHVRAFPIKNANGNGDLVAGIGQDITRRKFFEASLRESEEKWRSLMENSPDHIMLMDLDGHVLFANRGFMGMKKSDLIGKSIQKLIPRDFHKMVHACLNSVMLEGKPDSCCVENTGESDRKAYFELRMGPVTVNDQIVAVAVNSTEITDRVYQERALLESEAFHRTFFEDSPTGLAMQDFSAIEKPVQRLMEAGVKDIGAYLVAHPDEVHQLASRVKMVRVNQATVDLYRAPSAEHMIGPLYQVSQPTDEQHFIDQVVAFTHGEDRYEGEVKHRDYHGNTLHLIVRKVVIHRTENGLSTVLTSLIDVTPIKRAEKERELLMLQLQQAQKMESIGTLAGGVAHDFNNTLSIILGNAELSLADIPADNPAHLNLQEIRSASLRAKDIVRQLLGLSRKTEQILKPIRLVPVVEEAIKFLRATLPANITIQSSLSIEDDVVRADATQIHQIMINLFTNASHAMEDEGGILSVRAEHVTLKNPLHGPIHPVAPGRYVRVSVSDTGTGIADEIKARIFDPYFTTKAAGKGTGMGLSMVHGIIKSSGGGIVLNTQLGQGTTFDLYFRWVASPTHEVSSREEEIPAGKERILFVDDEAMIVELSRKILDRLGYRVRTCMDPSQAFSLIEADPTAFDMIITDMNMPGMNGDQLVQKIRKINPTLPVILCTGYSERMTSERAADLAISAVLDKPVALKQLASAIRQVFSDH